MVSQFHSVIVDKLSEFYDQGIPDVFERDVSLGEIKKPARSNLVQVIVGVRRCGKTYRLYQEMHRILESGYDLESVLYFNFDDERLKPYDSSVLDDVVETYYSMHPSSKTEGAFFFFDEIQEIPDWGAFMRRMVDTQVATIYVTGSSSKMLSLDVATEFRGRALSREMFPMGFSEYVRFHGHHVADDVLSGEKEASSAERARLKKAYWSYLDDGGFIAAQDLGRADATQLMQEYANRTVNYDIIERYGIGNPFAASLFLSRCMATSGRELSVNKIHNEFRSRGIAIGRESLSRLLGYYEEAYLLFSVKNYSAALADNARSAAKVYVADPALFGAFSPSSAIDVGQKLETAVFNRLRRVSSSMRPGAISRYLFEDAGKRHEIDFVVGDALLLEPLRLVQVSVSLDDPKTRKRELAALEAGMRKLQAQDAVIVTADEEAEIETSEGVVRVVPAWKWLLG